MNQKEARIKRIEYKNRAAWAAYPLEVLSDKTKPRECGECSACCTLVGVDSVGKGAWEKCKHQAECGCGIYETRPEECRKYQCLFQAGILKNVEYRPDKLKVMFDIRQTLDRPGEINILAWEVEEGAFNRPEVKALLKAIARYSRLGLRKFNKPGVVIEWFR